ncbi:hypothetical protein [Haloferula sargassicola]|uniref:DUF4132 domain-containing protein n=1 Tax=Haloferula sargassicola TaxID=490096 RepID=A0ABP9UHE5_9BACT
MVKSARVLPLVLWATVAGATGAENGDFSPAFRRLFELGVPDTSGAEWIKAPKDWQEESYTKDYPFSELGAHLRGELWKTADGRLLDLGGITSHPQPDEKEDDSPEKPGKLASALGTMLDRYRQQHPHDRTAAVPPRKRESLLESDMTALLKSLGDEGALEDLRDCLEYGRPELPGRLLVFAAQVHAAGRPDDAAKLARLLFSCAPEPTPLIDAAVSHIADSRYEALAEAFFDDYDWQAYHQGLENLLATFPRGWENRLAVARLAGPTGDRAAEKPIPAPELPDLELSSAARQAIDVWMSPPAEPMTLPEGVDLSGYPPQLRSRILRSMREGGSLRNPEGNWLLASPGDDPSKATDPIGKVTAFKMDAVILLAAVSDDETLTCLRNPGSRSTYYSSSDSLAERVQRAYAEMTRPMSRGEVARLLLAPVIPDPNEDFASNDLPRQTLRKAAVDFWTSHRNDSLVELCSTYVAEGSDSQRLQALGFLASTDTSEAAARFESLALEGDPLEVLEAATTYLTRRKAEGRKFFDRFAAKLEAELGGLSEEELSDHPSSWQIRRMGGADGAIKKLGVLVGAASVSDLLTGVIKNPDEDKAWSELSAAIDSIPSQDLLAPFAEAASEVEPKPRARLLQALMYHLSRHGAVDPPLLPDTLAASWKPLLADDSELPPDVKTSWLNYYGCRRTSTAAALVLEFVHNPDTSKQVNAQASLGDRSVSGIVLTRAKARFAGGELPDFASAAHVSDERKKEIAGIADEARSPLDLRQRVYALSEDERVAWLEWVGGFEGDDTPPRSLLDSRHTVTTVVAEKSEDHPDVADGVIEALGIEPGLVLDAGSIEKIAIDLLGHATEWSGLQLVAGPDKSPLGLQAEAMRPEDKQWLHFMANRPEVTESDAEAFVAVTIGNSNNFIAWSLKNGKSTPLSDKEDGEFPAFREFAKFLESDQLYLPHILFTVLTRQDVAELAADSTPFTE